MTPHLISSLDHSARRFVDTHGHGGEPLTWQADEHLFEECGLTRTPPTVNTAAVHKAVRNGVRRLSAIADEYGVSIDYLRYVAELFLVTGGFTDRATRMSASCRRCTHGYPARRSLTCMSRDAADSPQSQHM